MKSVNMKKIDNLSVTLMKLMHKDCRDLSEPMWHIPVPGQSKTYGHCGWNMRFESISLPKIEMPLKEATKLPAINCRGDVNIHAICVNCLKEFLATKNLLLKRDSCYNWTYEIDPANPPMDVKKAKAKKLNHATILALYDEAVIAGSGTIKDFLKRACPAAFEVKLTKNLITVKDNTFVLPSDVKWMLKNGVLTASKR